MIAGLHKNLPNVGIYIWDGLPYSKAKTNLTQHTIISSSAVFKDLSNNKSVADWMYDATNDEIKSYGLELLLDKKY